MFAAAFVLSLAVLAMPVVANAQEKAAEAPAKSTLENMMTAFAGESNAHARYLAFAKKADEEGYGKVASLFRAAARAEQVHFERHAEVIKQLGGIPQATIAEPVVKSTRENLEEALKGEQYENKIMYPQFLAQAKKEGVEIAVDPLEDAEKAEGVHASWYEKALAGLEAWKGPNVDMYVCPLCGNVVDVRGKAECPICATPEEKFMAVK